MEKSFKTMSVIEASMIELLTKNKTVSRDKILSELKISETSVDVILNKLMSTNTIKILESGDYQYVQPLEDDIVILEGQLLLPVAIIDEGETICISRGNKWYRFQKPFDIRRVVWNVDIVENAGNEKNQSLVDLLKTSIIKERRSSVVQLEEYMDLVNKMIPYNEDLGLHMTKIGEEVTEINIVYKIVLIDDQSVSITFKNFASRSSVSTIEVINELNKDVEEREYSNIKVDRQVELSDIIFPGNCIPIGFCEDLKGTKMIPIRSIRGKILKFVRLNKTKKNFSFDVCTIDNYGDTKTVDSYTYESISEGIDTLIGMCKPFVDVLFRKNDFSLDIES